MTPRMFPVWSRVALIVLLPIAAYTAWDYVETRRYEARLSAILQNGGLGYQQASGNFGEAERDYRAAAALAVPPFSKLRVDVRNRTWSALRGSGWTPEALGHFRDALAQNREPLAFVDRASKLPFDGFAPGRSYNYLASDLRTLATLCEIRAAVAANDGDADAAIASFAAEASLVRALNLAATTPLGVMAPSFSGLSRVTETTRPSAAVRDAAQRAFGEIDQDDLLRRSLVRLRAQMINGPPLWLYAPHPLVARALARSLDRFSRLLAVVDRPWPERMDAMKATDAWPSAPFFGTDDPPAAKRRELLDEFTKITAGQVRRIRCAQILLSTTPLTLIDPFTGKPLEVAGCRL